jgi:hypothetical protein
MKRRLSESKSRLDRQIVLWVEQMRSSLGIRRGVHHGNAYYKELSAQRLARALSPPPRGGGAKDYRVTFGDGTKQIVRCMRERCYADLMGPEHLYRLERASGVIRPGSRILEIATAPMLTGYSSAWLARMAGESGAVVALIADEEGARFAAVRYAAPNLSIERLSKGLHDALAGETDGAFHGIVHMDLPADIAKRTEVMKELWRVLAPDGWMLLGVRAGPGPMDEALRELAAGLGHMGAKIEGGEDATGPQGALGGVIDVLLSKRAQPESSN